MERNSRKYETLWQVIKSNREAIISIENAHALRLEQRQSVFKTIRKAVIKEKHIDGLFKKNNPLVHLEITQMENYHKIHFALVEKLDPKTAF